MVILVLDLPGETAKRRSVKMDFEREFKRSLENKHMHDLVRRRNLSCIQISQDIFQATQFQDPHLQ